MCGICGIVDFKNTPIPVTAIGCMIESMQRRGPDDNGTFLGAMLV